jgi:putative transport protein
LRSRAKGASIPFNELSIHMLGLFQLSRTQPIAHAILLLSSVSAAGLALGSLKYRGIALGSAGVLFAGILFGHFGDKIDHAVLDFAKEFGLVLFVFTIGLQLGPGFFSALREQGLKLNALAALIVAIGAIVTVIGAKALRIDMAGAVGVFSGATTNTPSLGAAQQALDSLQDFPSDRAEILSLAFAVAYPVGIAGIIGSVLILQKLLGIDLAEEAERLRTERQKSIEPLERMTLLVEDPKIEGVPLGQVPGRRAISVIVSRTRPVGTAEVQAASESTPLHAGDLLLAVGTRANLEEFAHLVGKISETDLTTLPGKLISRRIVVTRKGVLGKTVAELGFEPLYGATITRVSRGDLEMSAVPHLRLRFGDVVQVVGEPDGIDRTARAVGNSTKALNQTQFIPLFLGIALGVLVGIVPIPFPGLPVPVRLGLAVGPLMLGIILSRLGHVGKLVWYVPQNANMAIRELGITLFLAAVGLKAGEHFFSTLVSEIGLKWLVCALGTATLPLILVGAFARGVLKMNFATISGMISGSMTMPPTLASAGLMAITDEPQVAYATVYPLTMLLRILTAQTLALLLCR